MSGQRNQKMDLPLVRIPQLKISWCLKISVLLGLSGYMAHIVYHGPLCSLLRNSTVIRKNELNTEGTTNSFIHVHLHPQSHTCTCMHICISGFLCAWSHAWMAACVDHCMHGCVHTQD